VDEAVKRALLIAILGLVGARAAVACSNDYSSANAPGPDATTPDTGTHNPGDEGEVCFPNHTCNEALVCLSNHCVQLESPPLDSGTPTMDASTTDARLHPSDATTTPDACGNGTCGTDLGCPRFVIDDARNLAYDSARHTTWLRTAFAQGNFVNAAQVCAALGAGWGLPSAAELSGALADDSPGCAFFHKSGELDWSTDAVGPTSHEAFAADAGVYALMDSQIGYGFCRLAP
jgi:hypothetical protein